jgi:hypothetical protein
MLDLSQRDSQEPGVKEAGALTGTAGRRRITGAIAGNDKVIANMGEWEASPPGADVDDLSLALCLARKHRSAHRCPRSWPKPYAGVRDPGSRPCQQGSLVRATRDRSRSRLRQPLTRQGHQGRAPPSSPGGASSAPIAACTGAQLSGTVFPRWLPVLPAAQGDRADQRRSRPMPAVRISADDGMGFDRAGTKTRAGRGARRGFQVRDTRPRTDKGGPRPGGSRWFAVGAGTAYGGRSSRSTGWSSTSGQQQAGTLVTSLSPSAWVRMDRRERPSRSPPPPSRPGSPRSLERLELLV